VGEDGAVGLSGGGVLGEGEGGGVVGNGEWRELNGVDGEGDNEEDGGHNFFSGLFIFGLFLINGFFSEGFSFLFLGFCNSF
jgi:hypothetical protein